MHNAQKGAEPKISGAHMRVLSRHHHQRVHSPTALKTQRIYFKQE